jgi:hypothetical protein
MSGTGVRAAMMIAATTNAVPRRLEEPDQKEASGRKQRRPGAERRHPTEGAGRLVTHKAMASIHLMR